MGVEKIALLGKQLRDGLFGILVAAEAAGKFGRDFLRRLRLYGIFPVRGKRVHIVCNILARALHQSQQPFEVRGDENVHGRRRRLIERAVAVIRSGGEEVGQDIVRIRRAHKRSDRKPHVLGIITRQNVSEVAGRHAEVHLVAQVDGAFRQKVTVGGDVIHDLRQHAPPVDGVGRGQEITPLVQLRPDSFIGEDTLNAGLGVIKVADDRPDVHVLPLLGHHLPLLHGRDTVLGVVDLNTCLGHIRKAGHGRLAGITGGGR